MHIGLYNVDSKLPNLALMKISAYHKSIGNTVAWCQSPLEAITFDKVYGSQIFTDSERWDAPNLEMGGSGYDITKRLPKEIDDMKPDYSIYPDFTDNVGFTTRGCIRKCEFCFVPKMEGLLSDYRHISDIWRGSGNIVCMDNNILAKPYKFKEALEFCADKKIKIDFNQGLDCRLVNENIANMIVKYRSVIKPEIRFAFDSLDYRESVEKTIKLIGGIRCFWYVYCDENYESALERLLILKRLGQRAYLMRNKRVTGKGFEKYTMLANWSNCMGAMNKMDVFDHIHYYKDRDYFKKKAGSI